MKKIVALLLVLTFALSMTACKDSGSKKSLALGKTTSTKYESEFLGLGFTLPSGWTFYSDEQIRELNNVATDMVGDKYAEAIKKADIVYDMMAVNSSTGSNVNIVMEKKGVANNASSVSAYIELSMTSVKDMMESAGYGNVVVSKTNVTVGGKSCEGISLSCSYMGVTMYQKMACMKVGNYFVCITVATVSSDTTADVFGKFYTLK